MIYPGRCIRSYSKHGSSSKKIVKIVCERLFSQKKSNAVNKNQQNSIEGTNCKPLKQKHINESERVSFQLMHNRRTFPLSQQYDGIILVELMRGSIIAPRGSVFPVGTVSVL